MQTPQMQTPHTKRSALSLGRAIFMALVVLAATIALSACGGGGSSSSSEATESETTASETTGESTETSGESTEAGASSANEKVIEELTTRPSKIVVTQPVGKTIPTGKKIAYLENGVSSGKILGDSLEEAAELLGWEVTRIKPTSQDTSGFVAAMEQAMNENVDAITYESLNSTTFPSELAKAKERGIPVIEASTNEEAEAVPGLTSTVGGPNFLNVEARAAGKLMGALVEPNSVVGELAQGFIDLTELQSETAEGAEESCPTCSYAQVTVPVTQLDKTQSYAINFIRSKKPSALIMPNEFLETGLEPAMTAAGLDPNSVQGFGGNLETGAGLSRLANEENLLVAGFIYPNIELGWYVADAAARLLTGGSAKPSEAALQPWIVVKETAPPEEEPAVEGFQEEFKKLWGK
jgi:ABC-type sugar transport system substrate-binding protein